MRDRNIIAMERDMDGLFEASVIVGVISRSSLAFEVEIRRMGTIP